MASNLICKVVDCPGGQQIICARAWLWNGGSGWACLFGRHVMRKTGGNGGTFFHAGSGTFVTVLPVQSVAAQRLIMADAISTDATLDAACTDCAEKNYTWLKWLAVAALAYFAYKHFKKVKK